jgi:hypothetical protein
VETGLDPSLRGSQGKISVQRQRKYAINVAPGTFSTCDRKAFSLRRILKPPNFDYGIPLKK